VKGLSSEQIGRIHNPHATCANARRHIRALSRLQEEIASSDPNADLQELPDRGLIEVPQL
jgi:hypothetical protein